MMQKIAIAFAAEIHGQTVIIEVPKIYVSKRKIRQI
jgi:hypothetical protein